MSSTVMKALSILDLFLHEESSHLSMTEIGKCLDMDKSTTSRLLSSLEKKQLLSSDPNTKKYELGPKIIQLADRFYKQKDLSKVSLAYMKSLRDQLGETVSLQVRMGNHRVCIQQVQGLHEICWFIEVGKKLPLYAGSSGKVLLAFEPEQRIDQFLKATTLEQLTPFTITDPQQFKEKLKEIREKGYAIDMNERLIGLAGISVPIFNHQEEVIASLAVSGPSNRWSIQQIEERMDDVLEASRSISSALGSQISASVDRVGGGD